jgi:sirohydrochlorin ferrochelatase
MTTPALVAVAHGSRDPRSAATVADLVDVVRALRPGLDVRLAFLDLSAPRLTDVLAAVCGDGHRRAVVVPLLLGEAYHAAVDLPRAVREAVGRLPRLDVRISGILGPDPRLVSAALRRLHQAGAGLGDSRLGVVLGAAGSSHQPANDAVAAVAARWSRRAPWVRAVPAFASAATPDAWSAVVGLHSAGAAQVAVGLWFLAPGVLADRIVQSARAADPQAIIAEPLGADPEVAEVVLDRYLTAAAVHSHFATRGARFAG